MRKIILAFDGSHFPESALRFIQHINEAEKVLLIGAAMPALSRHERIIFEPMADGIAYDMAPLHEHDEAVKKAIGRFKALCTGKGIEHRIHKSDSHDPVSDLQKESRFADLLVIGHEEFYKDSGTGDVNPYLHKVLRHTECPVLLIPNKFNFPDKIILAYDGSESSVFAIKQFTYLLPEFTGLSALLVFASGQEKADIPDLPYLEELAARHYCKLNIHKLGLDPKEYFSIWVDAKKNAMVVMGSFGRSSLSHAFRKSLADEVIADRKFPIFIAHK